MSRRNMLTLLRYLAITSAIGMVGCGGSGNDDVRAGVQVSSATAWGDLVDVTDSFDITLSDPVIDNKGQPFDITLTLTNATDGNIHAPVHVLVGFDVSPPNSADEEPPTIDPHLSKAATRFLINQAGTDPDGNPYVVIPLLDNYAVPDETLKSILNFEWPDVPGFAIAVRVLARAEPAETVSVEISEPTSAYLDKPLTHIIGTYTGPARTSVTVNGRTGCVDPDAGMFWMNNFVLTEGLSTLFTASVESPAGARAEDTVSVTAPFNPKGVKVIGNHDCDAVAPFDAVFRAYLVNLDYSEVERIDADFDGDGEVDASLSDLAEQDFRFSYALPGMYMANFHLRMTGGKTYETTYALRVYPLAVALRPFEHLLDDLKNALLAQNVAHALEYFVPGARKKYSVILERARPILPATVSQWSDPVVINGHDKYTEYAIVRPVNGEDQAFRVSFVRDENGVWKISAM